jgi:hypothetical protein
MLTAPRDLGTVCEKRSGADLAFAAPSKGLLMHNRACLIFGCLLFTGCVSPGSKSQLTSQQISAGVALKTTPVQVLAFLDAQHIEHSSYRIDPVKGRVISAVSRGSKWSLIRSDHAVDFRFDDSDRLVAKDMHDFYTGP